ncbi:toll-like receptor 4 [Mercenaria mercenaria]|uniref:toll-like receptor 4 n=1 Tax=Mercenaria mercenaria TaxID=6596 RepID=UPI00234EDE9F|nr:toll-like receptor 4 [Mercenaria mercenaria]
MCLNLKEVNFNYVSIHTVIRENLNDVPSKVDVKKVPNNFKKLHLKGCLPSDRSPQLSIETSEEDTVIVKLSFRPAAIQWIFSFPADFINNLEFIDLSENELEHISMDLKGMSKLKALNVSKNNLFLMNTDTLIITFDLPELEELLASYNELGQVPRDIFTRTPKLAIIDLSHNKLSRISFKIEHLKLLKRLDVSYNNIKSIGDETRFSLRNMIQSRSSFNSNLTERNNTTFQLNIAGNPIECSCSSLEFLKWAMFQHFIIPQMLTCSLKGGRHVIDTDTVAELEEACKLPIVVVIGSSIGGVTFLLMIFAAFILFKRCSQNKKRRILQNRIQNYVQKNEEKESFPIFLSYSSKNSDFILRYILPELNRRLKERLKVDTDCVALGDYNFAIGRQVPDEMIRCIEN